MQLIRHLTPACSLAASIVTIGNFDGVHRGHQAMLREVRTRADAAGLPAVVVSFEPLPHAYFAADAAPARLQSLRDKLASLAALGIDHLVLLRFDAALAARSAEAFIDTVLVQGLGARHVVIGDDFRFGAGRRGDLALLERVGRSAGFTVSPTDTVCADGDRISSSRIRKHLQALELDAAAALLGRPYRISGRVIHGGKLGRQLGYPTANVGLKGLNTPIRGVFAAHATHLETGSVHPAVINLGERPTIDGRRLLLEAYLLDGEHALYGRHLAIDFLHHLRGERRFDSLDALKAQIGADAEDARRYLTAL